MRASLKTALIGLCLAAPLIDVSSANGAFPGANGKIAFTSDRDGSFQIYEIDANGGAATKLTNLRPPNSEPAWSADGQRLAFRCEPDGAVWICTMNRDGTGFRQVFGDLFDSNEPAWSPDGARIAFDWEQETCDETFECFLFTTVAVVNADGTNLQTVCCVRSPAWHPDGSKIAVNNGSGGIDAVEPDGNVLAGIVPSGSDANWSPDGSKIAYWRSGYPNAEIFVANADGSGETRLTNNPAFDGYPAWSPDGTQIAFESDEGGDFEIFVMNSDGTGRRAVTDNSVADFGPDWQPIPGPKRNDYKNAAQFCKAERDFLGESRFRQKYGGGANAYGKCVSAK
jgi:TolB protein